MLRDGVAATYRCALVRWRNGVAYPGAWWFELGPVASRARGAQARGGERRSASAAVRPPSFMPVGRIATCLRQCAAYSSSRPDTVSSHNVPPRPAPASSRARPAIPEGFLTSWSVHSSLLRGASALGAWKRSPRSDTLPRVESLLTVREASSCGPFVPAFSLQPSV